MAFLASLIQYLVIMIILVAVAVGGVFTGKHLRTKKNAKLAASGLQNNEQK